MDGFDQQMSITYNVDVVMCIDATHSMENVMNEVKQSALSFCDKFKKAMEEDQYSVEQVRVKVIAFRDYGVDADPMQVSDFFTLCGGEEDQNAQFKAFVDGIVPLGGGDIPGNALEALYFAIQSDWNHGRKRRHVILVFTDAPAHPLGDETAEYVTRYGSTLRDTSSVGAPGYPEDMPKSLAELEEYWDGQFLDGRGKRLLIFAPYVYPWDILGGWDQTYLIESSAGTGIPEIHIDNVIRLISHGCFY